MPTIVTFGRHVIDDDRIGANACAIAHDNGAQHLGTSADGDAASQGRMPLIPARTRNTQRHLMIKIAVIADFGGLADDDAHAVVEHDAPAKSRRGMDLDTGEKAREVRHAPAQEIKSMGP